MDTKTLLKKIGLSAEQAIIKHATTTELQDIINRLPGTPGFCKAQIEYYPNGLLGGSIFVEPETGARSKMDYAIKEELYLYKIFQGLWCNIGNETKAEGMKDLRGQYRYYRKKYQQYVDLLPDKELGMCPEGMTPQQFDKNMMGIESYIKREIFTQYETRLANVMLCSENPIFTGDTYCFIRLPDIVHFNVVDLNNQTTNIAFKALKATN